jgi:pimeloyl-ACP methyl ester carboxylesterase
VPDSGADRPLLRGDGSPDSDAEATAAFLLGREFAKSCQKSDGALIPYIGTRETVQDLEVLRRALGDAKLNYVGESYGTYIGALYADRFPSRVGRMVLDGAIDPSLTADEFAGGQALGFERALQDFIADCAQRSRCPLGRDPAAAEDRLNVFLMRLDSAPLTVGQRQLTQALATLGIIASFYSKSTWPQLRRALSAALRGDGSQLLALADFYSNRQADGTYADNSLDSFYAISCMDRTDTNGVGATQALAVKLTETVSRTFGSYLAWGDTPCQSWPYKPTESASRVSGQGAAPIVVVGTTRDPATPYEWAQSLSRQLLSAVLVTRVGEGHTGYHAGSACVDTAIDKYLVSGAVPANGLRCRT